MKRAGVSNPEKCYFIDDSGKYHFTWPDILKSHLQSSATNIDAARHLSWGHCVHFCEKGLETTEGGVKKTIIASTPDLSTTDLGERIQIDDIDKLRNVWPEIFKKLE